MLGGFNMQGIACKCQSCELGAQHVHVQQYQQAVTTQARVPGHGESEAFGQDARASPAEPALQADERDLSAGDPAPQEDVPDFPELIVDDGVQGREGRAIVLMDIEADDEVPLVHALRVSGLDHVEIGEHDPEGVLVAQEAPPGREAAHEGRALRVLDGHGPEVDLDDARRRDDHSTRWAGHCCFLSGNGVRLAPHGPRGLARDG